MVNTVYIEGKYRVFTEKTSRKYKGNTEKEKRREKINHEKSLHNIRVIWPSKLFKDKIRKHGVHNYFNLPESKLILLWVWRAISEIEL